MKPNKGICKKCWDSCGNGWQGCDEEFWGQGLALCAIQPNEGKMRTIDTTEDDLEDCPYRLEHLLNQ